MSKCSVPRCSDPGVIDYMGHELCDYHWHYYNYPGKDDRLKYLRHLLGIKVPRKKKRLVPAHIPFVKKRSQ